ncbi:hypothetical protein M427DRAFT_31411 [Gonapodya prolifera JEL478]|uniref:Uncharacterized protein n=1 Tax=Gonapodya prolifera (strain JEL478) TaxID=1344416 RepID=A0A139AHK4_GONPJ|nr:hypothetical protein M427DRAFT_31411 [Gonapodya prolifera JEL478]|eukprot:KXS16240.1 hypothetical protein M427DRAFT_31411 [Gonapodya prolifera JEL478]
MRAFEESSESLETGYSHRRRVRCEEAWAGCSDVSSVLGNGLSIILAVLWVPVVTPINYFATVPDEEEPEDPWLRFALTGLSRFSIANILPESPLLVVHLTFSWIVSFLVYWWLWIVYRQYVRIQNDIACETSSFNRDTPKADLKALRTVMVRDVPREMASDKGLRNYFKSLGFGEVEEALLQAVPPTLHKNILEREENLNKLESFRRGCFPDTFEPVSGNDGEALWNHTAERNRAKHWEGGTKIPVLRWLPVLRGQKVDSIDFYMARHVYLTSDIELLRGSGLLVLRRCLRRELWLA